MQAQSIFARDDTFFGVCEALGQDLGFNANLLRVTLAVTLFFSPLAAIGAYAAAAVLVLLSRWLVPEPHVELPAEDAGEAAPAEGIAETVEAQREADELAIAA